MIEKTFRRIIKFYGFFSQDHACVTRSKRITIAKELRGNTLRAEFATIGADLTRHPVVAVVTAPVVGFLAEPVVGGVPEDPPVVSRPDGNPVVADANVLLAEVLELVEEVGKVVVEEAEEDPADVLELAEEVAELVEVAEEDALEVVVVAADVAVAEDVVNPTDVLLEEEEAVPIIGRIKS